MNRKSAFAAIFLLGIAMPCPADSFTLKDGTTLEGVVVSDAGDSYVLEVQVTKSIKDERKILKSDVTKITRAEPDLKAFEAIEKLVPTPDLQTDDEYAVNLAAVQNFIKTYPASSKSKNAKQILDTLKSEVAQLSAGGIKINGKFVSPSEYQANAYDLDARVQEAKIRNLVNDNQFLPALRLFVDFDRDYRNTLAYGSVITLMKQVIQAHVEEARESLSSLDARTKERALGLQRMAFEDRKKTEEAIKSEVAELEALYKAEKDAKQSWPTTSPYHKLALEETMKFGQAELVRLNAVKTILGLDGGKAYREVWNAVQNGANATTLAAAIANAKAAAVAPRYLAPLEARAKGTP